MRILTLFLGALLIGVGLRAQDDRLMHSLPYDSLKFEFYKWNADPKLHSLSDDELKLDACVLLDRRIIEMTFIGQYPYYNYTVHKIVRINNDKAVERYNRVYISTQGIVELVSVRARSISQEGKITLLDKANIKTVANYENHGPFQIFAIDGIEKGGEVEYIYTLRYSANPPFGTIYLTDETKCKFFNFSILSDGYLLKGYNGFGSSVLKKEEWTGVYGSHFSRSRQELADSNFTEPKGEEFSAGRASLRRVEYQSSFIIYPPLYARMWEQYITSVNAGTVSKAKDELRQLKITKKSSDADAVQAIESYLKSNYTMIDQHDWRYERMRSIMEKKVANELGMTRLFVTFLKAAKVNYALLATSDRFEKAFDPNLAPYYNFNHVLLYLPSLKTCIDPSDFSSRAPYIDYHYTCQKGLLITKDSSGIFDMPCFSCDSALDNIYATVKLIPEEGNVQLNYKHLYYGTYAASYQPFYKGLSEGRKKEMREDVLRAVAKDVVISNCVVTGIEDSDLYRKPFVIQADLITSSLMEKAGAKYLFKVGEIIGPQTELYQEDKRETPIENVYNRTYHREITFSIPDGYRISNLDALNMDIGDGDSTGHRTLQFKSSYSVDGNNVKVTIEEFYNQIRYPVSFYEPFRAVVNASADFNKIVLFLEKQ